MLNKDHPGRLMLQLLEGFVWFDQRLQEQLRLSGMPSVNRTESMIMLYGSSGVVRPSELGQRIGLARQSINSAIRSLESKGLVRLVVDPSDARCKIIENTEQAQPIYAEAKKAILEAERDLAQVLGDDGLERLRDSLGLMLRG